MYRVITKALGRILTTVLLAMSLGACTQESAKQAPLRVGTNVWPGYEPLYLARDLGYLNELPVKLVEYSSASEVIRAFRNGAIEAAALTLDEVLLLDASGLEPRVVLVMDISDGGDVIIGRPGIERLADLSGRRVGVEETALGAYVLSRALELHNLKPDDIEVVSLEVAEHEAAYRSGQVDAVATFEPVRTKLLASGGHLLFDSREIPGEIVDVLVVRKRYLEQHGEVVSGLLEQWFATLRYEQQQPQDAALRISKRLGTTPDEFLDSLEGLKVPSHAENLLHLAGNAPQLRQAAEKLHQTMRAHGLLDKDVDVAVLLDGGML